MTIQTQGRPETPSERPRDARSTGTVEDVDLVPAGLGALGDESEEGGLDGDPTHRCPVTEDHGPGVARRGESIIRETARRLARSPWPTIGLHAGVMAGLLLLSVLAWWNVWITGHPTSTLTCQCGDVSQAVWFQSWTPWALVHGHNPLLSNAIFAGQGGANMLVNTSWIFPSLLLAPVTWLFGPVASFNVGVTLAPVVSGWAFFVAARAFTRFFTGQLLGSALWAFSPFVLAGLPAGHFQLSWLFYPPLAFLLLYELMVRRRRSPVVVGATLGVLTVVQFFTGTEVLAMSVAIGAVGSLVALAVSPRTAWANRRHVLVGLGTAAGVAAVVLAYPTWFLADGPRHIVGSQWAHTSLFGNTPSAILDVGAWDHRTNAFLSVAGYFGPAGPSAAFLGAGLLAFVGASCLVWYRMRAAWVIAATGLAGWVLSFGTIFGGLSQRPVPKPAWWLPWTYLSRLPLLSDVIAQRFSLFTTLAAALLLAVSADRWWAAVGRVLPRKRLTLETSRRRSAMPSIVLGLVVTGVCLAVVSPIAFANNFPFVVHPSPAPSWFRHEAPKLPSGTVVLALPDPSSASVAAMGWQAEDSMQISLVGGYADTPDATGRSSWAEQPSGVLGVLDALSEPLSTLPSGGPNQVAAVRRALRSWRTHLVVVTGDVASPAFDVAYFTAVVGRAPMWQEGAWVWYGLGRGPALRPASGLLARCASGSSGKPVPMAEAILSAQCVLHGAPS